MVFGSPFVTFFVPGGYGNKWGSCFIRLMQRIMGRWRRERQVLCLPTLPCGIRKCDPKRASILWNFHLHALAQARRVVFLANLWSIFWLLSLPSLSWLLGSLCWCNMRALIRSNKGTHKSATICLIVIYRIAYLLFAGSLCQRPCPFKHYCDEVRSGCRCSVENHSRLQCQLCKSMKSAENGCIFPV